MPSMRITNSIANRRYIGGLERNFKRKNDTENKIINNRKYTRASQSPMEAVSALKVRKAMAETESYLNVLSDAADIYNSAESAVRQISDIIHNVYEKLIQGASGTYSVQDDKQIIAEEIDAMGEEMVRTMNLIVADRRIFGGVNDSSLAFKIDGGAVYFNGVPVNRFSDPSMFPDGKTSYIDAGMGMQFLNSYDIDSQTVIPVTFNGAQILGCGLDSQNFNVDWNWLKNGDTYKIKVLYGGEVKDISFTAGAMLAGPPPTLDATATPEAHQAATVQSLNAALQSAFGIDPDDGSAYVKVTADGLFYAKPGIGEFSVYSEVSGQENVISAVPSFKFPKNIIQLTLDAAKCMRSGDDEKTAWYADMLFKAQSNLSLSIAKIGSDQSFIEFNQERLQGNLLSLKDRQNTLEYPDLAEESTNWKMFEMIYNAALQLSSSTIPMSIFSFMR